MVTITRGRRVARTCSHAKVFCHRRSIQAQPPADTAQGLKRAAGFLRGAAARRRIKLLHDAGAALRVRRFGRARRPPLAPDRPRVRNPRNDSTARCCSTSRSGVDLELARCRERSDCMLRAEGRARRHARPAGFRAAGWCCSAEGDQIRRRRCSRPTRNTSPRSSSASRTATGDAEGAVLRGAAGERHSTGQLGRGAASDFRGAHRRRCRRCIRRSSTRARRSTSLARQWRGPWSARRASVQDLRRWQLLGFQAETACATARGRCSKGTYIRVARPRTSAPPSARGAHLGGLAAHRRQGDFADRGGGVAGGAAWHAERAPAAGCWRYPRLLAEVAATEPDAAAEDARLRQRPAVENQRAAGRGCARWCGRDGARDRPRARARRRRAKARLAAYPSG